MKQERIICDRCKKEIKRWIFPKIYGEMCRTLQFSNDTYNCNRTNFELCLDCMKDLEKFMEGKDDA